MKRLGLLPGVGLVICCWLAGSAAAAERVLAIYLPSVFFGQIERKLDLGNELAAHLAKRPGEKFRPQVYATLEAMEADFPRIGAALVESPYVAANLQRLLPVAVAFSASSASTRLAVLAVPSVKNLFDVKRTGLVFAAPLPVPNAFLENCVFEGELSLGSENLMSARDVGSALSLLSLHKAEAVLLYEEALSSARIAGARPIYRSDKLPRPTFVLANRAAEAAEVSRLKEALAVFSGRTHADIQAFRPTTEQPYQKLRERMQHKPKHIPGLLDVTEEAVPWPTPQKDLPAPVQVPLRLFAPES